jgi:hypothetical protein
MKRISTIVFSGAAVFGVATLAGCGTSSHSQMHSTQTIALAEMGPARVHPEAVSLGAGDALGQAIFANYITIVRAASPQLDAVYASGSAERMTETD